MVGAVGAAVQPGKYRISKLKDVESSFWQFSLALYRRSRVASTCLRLQDDWTLDVNLLLYCLWQGGREHRLKRETLEDACRASAEWARNVVQPLRGARRWIKGKQDGVAAGAEPLRERIKALELAAEKQQQDWLAALPAAYDSAPPPIAAAGNLALYLEIAGVAAEPALLDSLATLLAEAHPEAGEGALSDARATLGSAQETR